MRLTLALALLLAGPALAQTTEFPADASPVSAEALRAHLTGNVFRVAPVDGSIWRLEFKDGGYAFIDVPNRSYRNTGTWYVDGTRLCTEWRQEKPTCQEARMKDRVVYLKRPFDGEVMSLTAQ